ncbi:MAG: sulfatase [Planctomycetota bacterium]|nr:MAG: sulfatase [Planctomycetota bacterium]
MVAAGVTWICIAVLHFAAQRSVAAESQQRPNILLIYADDQSYKTISCYQSNPPWVQTPNIDALARRGVRFHRAYLGAWCMPSRASMLTGRLQHAVPTMRMEGTYPASTYDPERCRFVAEEFRRQGYHTAQIGKWHTGTDTGYPRAWDYQIVWNRPGHPENAGNYYYDQILTFNGQDRLTPGYSTDNYTQWAVEYLEGQHRDSDKPWFLWVCYGAIHGPTTPAERHRGSLAGKQPPIPADIFGPWPDKPAYLERTAAWIPGPDGHPALRRKNVPRSNFNVNDAGKRYDDWIQQVNECNMALDEGVGQLIETLRRTGQLDNTLIIYTADQGYGLGEHGFNQKVAPYDATVASPLIISQPTRLPSGKVCRHAVNAPDLVDFICRWAGVEIPWKMDGRDIRPLVQSPETAQWNLPMLMTHTARSYGEDTAQVPQDDRLTIVGNVPWYALLRSGQYKYIRNLVPGEVEELYDLDSDPEELRNLALEAEYKSLLAQLRDQAIAELRRTDAGFVDNLPPARTE